MKPENILKSDYLDILFENKNKAYGAYELRKTYPKRLLKSLGIMLGCILVFVGTQSWKTPKKKTKLDLGYVKDITLEKIPIEEKEKEKPKEIIKKPATKPMAEVAHNTPIIVKEDIETQVPPIDIIDTSAISNKTNLNAPASEGLVGVIAGPTEQSGNGGTSVKTDETSGNEEEIFDEPIANPSQQPEYPGGIEALRNFMLRHLKQPDDIDEGSKIVVVAKFVVDKSGAIEHIEIIKNGREDLDNEVKRVIKKMPNWKPGVQAGKAVDVYFKLPVTFTSQEY